MSPIARLFQNRTFAAIVCFAALVIVMEVIRLGLHQGFDQFGFWPGVGIAVGFGLLGIFIAHRVDVARSKRPPH